MLCTAYAVAVSAWVAYSWGYHRGRLAAENARLKKPTVTVDWHLLRTALNGAGFDIHQVTPPSSRKH